jgi:uncharacterized protein
VFVQKVIAAAATIVLAAVVGACMSAPADDAGLAPARGGVLEQMPRITLDLNGATHSVRLAATPETRAQGFQHVPEPQIHHEAIYFQFEEPLRPAFHMHNVAVPLLIAWIAADGRVLDVDLMQPGRAGYRPPAPVVAALEFTTRHALAAEVRAGVRIRLDPPPSQARLSLRY